jgi:translation machinery-associated protein 16
MPNNKKKALKQVKGLDKAHPYSRKATQMNRIILRKATISANELKRADSKSLLVQRMLAFQEVIDMPVHEMIDAYICRNDDEIAELRDAQRGRSNRVIPARLSLLENLRLKDVAEYKNGMEVPEQSPKNVERLKNWNGDHNSITQIKTVRVVCPPAPKFTLDTAASNEEKVEAMEIVDVSEKEMAVGMMIGK